MTINKILNFFSFSRTQQEDGNEPGFTPQIAVIGTLAAGVLALSAQYSYTKYAAYRLRCQEYQDLCQGLDRWCQEAEASGLESRSRAADRIRECYWKREPALKLSYLRLTSLPPEIGQLTHLQELDLCENQLQTLPQEIGRLKNLRELSLYRNRFQQPPLEIGQLTNLRVLHLFKNQLQELPKEIGQLTNLTKLTLSDNPFRELPQAIEQLTNLQHLDLDRTLLEQLSSRIGQLTNLRKLLLSGNRLQQLPPEIGLLTNLERLNLFGNNDLQQLPPEIGQLTNLRELYLPGNNNLQQLPQEILQLTNLANLSLSDSTAQASQELVASLRNAGVSVFIRSFFPSQLSFSTFSVNLQRLQDDPISVLRALQEPLKENHSFPKIIYEDSDGIDAGALSRDLVTRLFKGIFDKENPQLPILELDDFFLPMVDSDFNYSELYQSWHLYQAIGMIFAAAARKGSRPIITGKYFHPVLFEMLYCLSQEDLNKLPDQFATFSDLPKDILKKLLSSHLYSKVDGSDEQKKESASLLTEAFIENQFPDLFGIYESREEFLKAYPYADKIVLATPGALAIAHGMYKFLQNWQLNADSAIDLQLNIEGYFSREDVENILSWQEGANSPQNDQTKEFLLQWIRDETTRLKTISQFLFAGTGSSTIIKGKNFHISFYSAEGPEEGPEWFPKYRSCSFSMKIPRNYSDYETFKQRLEASIGVADLGFQTI
ncbi:MAG: leucine-rich repeat domain-containing protein [Chlamydiales bacterium]|nr:leucine-rich repeat domain-containing protein [Chlamydiales bacterium]